MFSCFLSIILVSLDMKTLIERDCKQLESGNSKSVPLGAYTSRLSSATASISRSFGHLKLHLLYIGWPGIEHKPPLREAGS